MSRSPKPKAETAIFLYIAGIALVVTAAIVLLKGLGVLSTIPSFVIWALVLFTIGAGIIGGLKSLRG